MTPAHLALAAAAALLVCARADTLKDSLVLKMFPDIRQDRTYNIQRDMETHNSFANDRKDIEYNALKDSDTEDTQKIFPNDSHDKTHNTQKEGVTQKILTNDRKDKAYTSSKTELPSACLYDGRWHSDGATVSTREDCLRCVCARGALSCRRRACAPLPEPLPPRCHVRHRRGVCCPELHCPDGVQLMEHGALARFESVDVVTEAEVPTATPASANNACVEGGSVFAAGSALASRVACEQCFCLRGARRCVRPSCLPPPAHCAPRPAPGACCPQRYYCDNAPDRPTHHRNQHDCLVDGSVVSEGSAVAARGNCSACFCLRGEVRCQALGCAPALAGCRPLLAPGDCCANQYVCDHDDKELPSHVIIPLKSSPTSMKYDERNFYSSKSSKLESTTKKIISNLYTMKHTSFASATKNHLITTTKVKRKTDEPPLSASQKLEQDNKATSTNITTTQKPLNVAKLIAMPELDQESDDTTAEQPDETVKIVINGTINCTAELSSTSLPLSITVNDTDKIQMEAMPRVPIVNVEAQTYSPNDIITDRNVNDGFDEDDSFTINVTSSLMANTSHSTASPVATAPKIPAGLAEALNSSKKKKGEYDYDYTEPTLPPSLPNLKIIPFVAADAVVDDEPTKDTYPMLEREDKFPVYYPTAGTRDTTFPNRREDTYQPTQYPVFVLGKEPSYPTISHEDQTRDRYPERNDLGVHEYTVSASLGSHGSEVKAVTNVPTTGSTFAMETPAVNLFSPPVKTEGGFIPKGSGVIDEYFAVFPSTPPSPTVPHLTTSMQLDALKGIQGECVATDGRRVPGGQSIVMGCQVCTCSWVELSCERRQCSTARGCRRLPPSDHSRDPCCGDLDCTENSTTSAPALASDKNEKQNETKVEVNQTSDSSTVVPLTNKTITATKANNTEKVAVNSTTPPNVNSESVPTTPVPTTTSAQPTTKLTTTTTPAPQRQVDDISHEDEDEDDDEEFSFGSVLKLLLSDSYETTTAPNKKLSSKPPVKPAPIRSPSDSAPPTSRPEIGTESESFFKPLPPHHYNYPSFPPKISPNTVNRIDHLVLGEATAIKRTTLRPMTNKTTKRPLPQTYDTTERKPVIQEEPVPFLSVATEGPRPPNLGGLPGSGLLKLAGCNIYGRMYRVGRIITELSTPCQECWCTELGVQCKPLDC